MALNIKIDIENRYELTYPDNDFHYNVFHSPLLDGKHCRMAIKISREEHPLINDVHNLAFGPTNERHEIDDLAKLSHRDHSKVFSTIVFVSLTYLTTHPNKFLGIDGSDTRRAYLYYRCIKNNFTYLDTLFDIYGVNYYIRLYRDNEYATDDYIVVPTRMTSSECTPCEHLYNYFIFRLKKSNQ